MCACLLLVMAAHIYATVSQELCVLHLCTYSCRSHAVLYTQGPGPLGTLMARPFAFKSFCALQVKEQSTLALAVAAAVQSPAVAAASLQSAQNLNGMWLKVSLSSGRLLPSST